MDQKPRTVGKVVGSMPCTGHMRSLPGRLRHRRPGHLGDEKNKRSAACELEREGNQIEFSKALIKRRPQHPIMCWESEGSF